MHDEIDRHCRQTDAPAHQRLAAALFVAAREVPQAKQQHDDDGRDSDRDKVVKDEFHTSSISVP
jgi:hypothetical protein